MNDLFHKFICLLTFCFILISCGSSPNSSQQPVQRQLKRYTTYQTSLTNEDIMRGFVNEVRTYLQRYDRDGCYYLAGFVVFQDRNDQNFVWETRTYERKHQGGTEYLIGLSVNNAAIFVVFSNSSFSTIDDQDARRITTTRSDTVNGNDIRKDIVDTALSMFEESEMVLKMNNRNLSEKSKTVFLAEIMRIMQ